MMHRSRYPNPLTCRDTCIRRSSGLVAVVLSLMLAALSGCSSLSFDLGQKPAPAAMAPDLLGQYKAALAMMAKGDYQEALPNLKTAVAALPDRPGPHFNLGIAQYHTGNLKDAMASLQYTVDVDPEMAAAHNLMGIIKREAGEFDTARKSYEQALDADPDYANAELNLAILYDIYLRRPEQALLHYNRFMDLKDGHDDTVAQWVTDLKLRIKKVADKAADGKTS